MADPSGVEWTDANGNLEGGAGKSSKHRTKAYNPAEGYNLPDSAGYDPNEVSIRPDSSSVTSGGVKPSDPGYYDARKKDRFDAWYASLNPYQKEKYDSGDKAAAGYDEDAINGVHDKYGRPPDSSAPTDVFGAIDQGLHNLITNGGDAKLAALEKQNPYLVYNPDGTMKAWSPVDYSGVGNQYNPIFNQGIATRSNPFDLAAANQTRPQQLQYLDLLQQQAANGQSMSGLQFGQGIAQSNEAVARAGALGKGADALYNAQNNASNLATGSGMGELGERDQSLGAYGNATSGLRARGLEGLQDSNQYGLKQQAMDEESRGFLRNMKTDLALNENKWALGNFKGQTEIHNRVVAHDAEMQKTVQEIQDSENKFVGDFLNFVAKWIRGM